MPSVLAGRRRSLVNYSSLPEKKVELFTDMVCFPSVQMFGLSVLEVFICAGVAVNGSCEFGV